MLFDKIMSWFCFIVQRNGADFSVFVNTGQEFDGSDSGTRPDEAVSWGKTFACKGEKQLLNIS